MRQLHPDEIRLSKVLSKLDQTNPRHLLDHFWITKPQTPIQGDKKDSAGLKHFSPYTCLFRSKYLSFFFSIKHQKLNHRKSFVITLHSKLIILSKSKPDPSFKITKIYHRFISVKLRTKNYSYLLLQPDSRVFIIASNFISYRNYIFFMKIVFSYLDQRYHKNQNGRYSILSPKYPEIILLTST